MRAAGIRRRGRPHMPSMNPARGAARGPCGALPALLAGLVAALGGSAPDALAASTGAAPATPVTARLQALQTPHPRLYLDAERMALLAQPPAGGPWDRFREHVLRRAGGVSDIGAVADAGGDADDDGAGGGGDLRAVSRALPYPALAAIVDTPERREKHLGTARALMESLVAMPDWKDNLSRDSAEALFSLSLGYDWLHDRLDAATRARVREKIARQADALHGALMAGERFWAKTRLHNQNYTVAMAIGVAGVALLGEVPAAARWLAGADANFEAVLEVLSPDGASHEGVGYWSSGTASLLRYFLALAPAGGLERVRASAHLRNAARFRLHASLPGFADNVDYADSPRADFHGPGFILRALAGVFRDGTAQWLADRIDAARGPRAGLSWLDLLWYDPTVTPVAPPAPPVHAQFANLGLHFVRDGWETPAHWAFFEHGPPQGRLALALGLAPESHAHPDAGNFLLWHGGDWVVIDDGYVVRKRSGNHNVLLIDGQGQTGEGKRWFDDRAARRHPPRTRLVTDAFGEGWRYLAASLAGTYPPRRGLERWERTFVHVAPGTVVIRDDVALRRTLPVESRIHLARRPRRADAHTLCLDAGGLGLRVSSEPPASVTLAPYEVPKRERKKHGNYAGWLVSARVDAASSVRILHVFLPDLAACGGRSEARHDAGRVRVTGPGREFEIDFDARTVRGVER